MAEQCSWPPSDTVEGVPWDVASQHSVSAAEEYQQQAFVLEAVPSELWESLKLVSSQCPSGLDSQSTVHSSGQYSLV